MQCNDMPHAANLGGWSGASLAQAGVRSGILPAFHHQIHELTGNWPPSCPTPPLSHPVGSPATASELPTRQIILIIFPTAPLPLVRWELRPAKTLLTLR